MDIKQAVQTFVHVMLAIVIIVFILTGFGITNYQTVETITAGILTKPTSFQIHTNLVVPLIILLAAHMLITLQKKYRKKI